MSEDQNSSVAHKTPRRLAREVALQGLYQWRMSGNSLPIVEESLESDSEEWEHADKALALVLLRGAIDNAESLEEGLTSFTDRPLEEISPIERAILLLGAYELTYRLETPYRVVINEAIELAKAFGGTDGHRYVNGVLDKLAPSVRAAEVEHTARHKSAKKS